MKKTAVIVFMVALMTALLISLNSPENALHPPVKRYFGFSKEDFTVIEEKDTHGGFHGDGFYTLILDCSGHADAALKLTDGWNKLPLSENLNLIMYGGQRDSVIYGYHLSEYAQMPPIENGFYCFKDRHSEAEDAKDDSELLSRYSFNFSLAVYDCGTDRLYYFEYDT